MTLTEKEMIEIINNKTIANCSEEEKKQVMVFAFGEEFMVSKSKEQS